MRKIEDEAFIEFQDDFYNLLKRNGMDALTLEHPEYESICKLTNKVFELIERNTFSEEERTQKQRERILKRIFPKGSTAYTTVMKVAPSGMSRHIKILSGNDGGGIQNVSWYVSEYLDMQFKDDTDAVFIRGGGMDMGFELIYRLSQSLYGDGYAIKQRWV